MLNWPWNRISRSKSSDTSDKSPSRVEEGTQEPPRSHVEQGTQKDTPSRIERGTQTDTPSRVEKGTQAPPPPRVEQGTPTDAPSRIEQGTQTSTGEPFAFGSRVSVSSDTATPRLEEGLFVEGSEQALRNHPFSTENLRIQNKQRTVEFEDPLQRNSLKPILVSIDSKGSERVTDCWRQPPGSCGGSIRSRGSVEPPPIPEKTTTADEFYSGPTRRTSPSPQPSLLGLASADFVRNIPRKKIPESNLTRLPSAAPLFSSALPRPSQPGSPRPPSSVFEGPPISIAEQPNPWQDNGTKEPNTRSTASQVGNIDSDQSIQRHSKPPSIRPDQTTEPPPRFPIPGINSEFTLAVPSRTNSIAANPFTDYESPVASGSAPVNPPVQSNTNAANPPTQSPGQGDSNRTPDNQGRTSELIRTRDPLPVESLSETMTKKSWPHVEDFLRKMGDAHPWGRSGYFLELVLRGLQAQLAAGIPWALFLTALAFSGDRGPIYGLLSIPVLMTFVFTALALLSPGSFEKPLFMIGEIGMTALWLVFIIIIKTELLDKLSSRDSSTASLLAHEGKADRILRWYGAGVVCVNGVFLLLRGVLCLVGRAGNISAGFGKLLGEAKVKKKQQSV